jgi:pSer/pThr/pTyr-binding forkhead associated (FHA) protein
MPIITLKFKDRKIRDYPIAVGQTCTIGRKSSNDIVIDNLAVSGFHARIESVVSTFILRDLESTNGTFVNKEKVTAYNLRHKDVILIGKHELIFDRSDMKKQGEGDADPYQDDKTRILDTNDYRKLMKNDSQVDSFRTPTQDGVKREEKRGIFTKLWKWITG